MCFFLFQQKTAYEMRISDWSSDVCSSDLDLLAFQAELECQLATLEWLGANQWIDGGLEDFLRGIVSDFLDVHATFGGSHEHDTAARTVNNSAQVQIGRGPCRERGCQYV